MDMTLPRESRTLEYKEVPESGKNADFKSYLKTVSAYANYVTGDIIFGVSDDRIVKGVKNAEQFSLNIENQINDNLQPVPEFTLNIQENQTVKLTVQKGRNTPYLYKGIAYCRRDASSLPVGREQLRELSMAGANVAYEDLPAQKQDLTFQTFSEWAAEKIPAKIPVKDLLISNQMFSDEEGYTNAAFLLSDENSFGGVSIMQFGKTTNEILFSARIDHQSVLDMYSKSCRLFNEKFSLEVIEGMERVLKFQIPETAFRETIANALVHRDWQTTADIQISFFPDNVVVASPGGLPDNLTKEDYLCRMISQPRNLNLAIVFQRLGLIERFGTGIERIRESYRSSINQPQFDITDHHITITLPFFESQNDLSREAASLLALIRNGTDKKKELIGASGLSSYQVNKVLQFLEEKRLIRKVGNTRAARYLPVA